MAYGDYYELWRAIADEFGVPEESTIRPERAYRYVKHVGSGADELTIPGIITAFSPYKKSDGSPSGPPVLHFQPDALSHLERNIGAPAIHYEWVLQSGWDHSQGWLDAALHFHFRDALENAALYEVVSPVPAATVNGQHLTDQPHTFRKSRFYAAGWTCRRYRLPCEADAVLADPGPVAKPAAAAMEHLIRYTWKELLEGWGHHD